MTADAHKPAAAHTSSDEARGAVLRPRRRRLRRALLSLLLLIFLAQLPFIYRRFELRALDRAIQKTNAARVAHDDANFREYTGVVHVHTSLGGHSAGTLADVIRAAQINKLDFVVMTEHTEGDYDTSTLTLAGLRGGVLFVPGNETQTRTRGRFLVLPGAASVGEGGKLASQDFAARERAAGRAVFVAYPQEFSEWGAVEFDGIEVYNLFTNARSASPVTLFFDGLWSLGGYPDLIFARLYERPSDALARWDRLAADGALPIAALAGVDAHANIGIGLRLDSGESLAGLHLDPYERSFRIVRMHVLLPHDAELNTETLIAALRQGRGFIAFDIFGDSTGFRFTATSKTETRTTGETISLTDTVTLRVRAPLASRIVLFRNGVQVEERRGTEAEFACAQPGAYRVEVYRDDLPLIGGKPWIVSNHIRLRGNDER